MNPIDSNSTAAEMELSVVIPCLNEHRTLGICIEKAHRCMQAHDICGEVIVADNGSTDGSLDIAQEKGARIVHVKTRGYGAALFDGIAAAKSKFVIMGDADDTYDFSLIHTFVDELRKGYELVLGNRFKGGIEPGAMPPTHRYFGNPLLSALGRRLFRCPEIGDFYCGLRGFHKEAIQRLNIQSTGMEFALEMIVKSGINGLKITEVPTTLSRDVKDRIPHLRTCRDGWRSLRFFLTMSPHWVYSIPGAILAIFGGLISLLLFPGSLTVQSITFDYHSLLYTVAATVIGYQGILLGASVKLIQAESGLHPLHTKLDFLRSRSVTERLLQIAGVLLLAGVVFGAASFYRWAHVDFGALDEHITIRLVIASVLFLILGSQTFLAGFYFSTINMLAERRIRFGVTQN
jgi:glycosyltransferase involved in cell wall biosynthesis